MCTCIRKNGHDLSSHSKLKEVTVKSANSAFFGRRSQALQGFMESTPFGLREDLKVDELKRASRAASDGVQVPIDVVAIPPPAHMPSDVVEAFSTPLARITPPPPPPGPPPLPPLPSGPPPPLPVNPVLTTTTAPPYGSSWAAEAAKVAATASLAQRDSMQKAATERAEGAEEPKMAQLAAAEKAMAGVEAIHAVAAAETVLAEAAVIQRSSHIRSAPIPSHPTPPEPRVSASTSLLPPPPPPTGTGMGVTAAPSPWFGGVRPSLGTMNRIGSLRQGLTCARGSLAARGAAGVEILAGGAGRGSTSLSDKSASRASGKLAGGVDLLGSRGCQPLAKHGAALVDDSDG